MERPQRRFPLLLFLVLSSTEIPSILVDASHKTWCVAKPSTDDRFLSENIHYSCSNVDCNILEQVSCKCFYPNSLTSHASVAMNLYYQAMGRNPWNCNFNNSGYGGCAFA